jgi:hypothetical protein
MNNNCLGNSQIIANETNVLLELVESLSPNDIGEMYALSAHYCAMSNEISPSHFSDLLAKYHGISNYLLATIILDGEVQFDAVRQMLACLIESPAEDDEESFAGGLEAAHEMLTEKLGLLR